MKQFLSLFIPPISSGAKESNELEEKKYLERECIANHETVIDSNRNVTSIRRKTTRTRLFISFGELHFGFLLRKQF